MTALDPTAPPLLRTRTATSAFGVSRRESHDASAFYNRFDLPELSDNDDVRRPSTRDRIWCGDARHMDTVGDVADRSVALVVTSPPYFAGKEYEQALGAGHTPATYRAYLQMLEDVFAECARKLEPGGRIAINVANLGRKPYRSLAADVIAILQRLGLLLRGEIVWVKARGASGSCAWGTYQRPGNPVLRDLTERIIVASKGRFDRAIPQRARAQQGLPSVGSVLMDEFLDATLDVWEIAPESATRVGHPAPFPVELPRRLIELYTYRDDLVLDPFMGSGTTAVAALRTGRSYIGFDTDPDYLANAHQRIVNERARLQAPEGDHPTPGTSPLVTVAAGTNDEPESEDLRTRLIRSGAKANDVAHAAVQHAGLADLKHNAKYPALGIDIAYQGWDDARSGLWLIDIAGAYSATRPGLRRPATAWEAIAKAALLHQARLDGAISTSSRYVILTTATPPARSALRRALDAITGPDRPIHAIVDLGEPNAFDALKHVIHHNRPGAPGPIAAAPA